MKRKRILGELRPKPLRVVVVNGMSASGVTQERSLRILRTAANAADVVLGCEFSNVTCDNPLPDHEWDVIHDPSSSDRAGSLIAVRRSRVRVVWDRYRLGRPARFGIRRRWIIVARLVVDRGTPHEWRPKVGAGHAPPMRAWGARSLWWLGFMASVRARRFDVFGGDMNKLGRAVGPALNRKVRMTHIVGVAVRRWLPASDPIPMNVGADHKAVLVTLYPHR